MLALAGCYDFNNPVDPEADSYQGFRSDPVSAPPVDPGNLVIWAYDPDREHGVRLTWKDNSDNEECFYVERHPGTGVFAEIAKIDPDVTEYIDLSLSGDTTYTYRVRAYNAAGYSAYTVEPSWQTAPAAPSNAVVEAGDDQITVKWLDNATTETGFIVQRSENGDPFVNMVLPGADVESWIDTSVSEGIPYTYRVRAYRTTEIDVSSPSNEASATAF
jgi:hypothetical protein